MARKDKKKKTPPKEQSTSTTTTTGNQEVTSEQQPVNLPEKGTSVIDSPIETVNVVVGQEVIPSSDDDKNLNNSNNQIIHQQPPPSPQQQQEQQSQKQTDVFDETANVKTTNITTTTTTPTVESTVDQIADSLATEAAVEATVEAAALIHSSSTPKMDKENVTSTPNTLKDNSTLSEIESLHHGQMDEHHYSSTSVMALNGSEINASDLREESMMIESIITDGERSSFSDSDVVMICEDTLRSGSDDGENGEMVQISMSMIEDPDEPIDRKTDVKSAIDKSELPETVTILKGPIEGSYVYLVGTAHFSEQSNKDVAETIKKVQPNIVVVELCASRYDILQYDEEKLLNQSSNLTLESIRENIRRSGLVQGILYSCLLSLSAHLTRELKIAPGGEFRRALQEAKKIPGCIVQLGDRPVEISVGRAFSSLTIWERVRLAFTILLSNEKITPEDVEKCKQKDLLHAMLNEIAGEFPAFSRALLEERDLFLAYSLQLAAKPIQHVKKPDLLLPTTVVGVVGIGHVDGIAKHFGKVTEQDIQPIMTIPPPSIMSVILVKGFKYTTLCILGYGIYRYLVPNYVKTLAKSSVVASVFSIFRAGVSQLPKPKTK